MRHRIRVRQHVNPLLSKFEGLFAHQTTPLFAHLHEPLEVELGCADAQFLFERARQEPTAYYVGVEIRKPWVEWVNQQAQRQGLINVQAVFANLNHDLPALFQPGQLLRVFVNFPDPWFKRDHHKRRLVRPAWAQEVITYMALGGELFFQSDVFALALEALAVFEQTPGLANMEGEWSFAKGNPYGAQSLREQRALAANQPIWRMRYQRIS